MRAVLLTSDSLRHRYIARKLATDTRLTLVIAEKKSPQISQPKAVKEEDQMIFRDHFLRREESEKDYFADFQDFPDSAPILHLNHGEINTSEVYRKLQEENPDYIILFGTSIISDRLLEPFQNRMVNLHLGLSPYYRGSATNLYPYYFREPECIGATIHLVTSEVDKGGILHQHRPSVKPNDDPHSIGNRLIWEAGRILPLVLQKFDSGEIIPRNVEQAGRLCRNRDITGEVLRQIYQNFSREMIREYLEVKKQRDDQKPIVQQLK